jgi:hypothetical protein
MPSDRIMLSQAGYLPQEERFWSHVKKTKTCWLWRGSKTTDGYGQFSTGTDRGTVGAHVFSFYLHHGRWPSGDVCHSRDCARNCVNPYHLDDGPHAENIRDIYEHRRERENLAAKRIIDLEKKIGSLEFAVRFLDNENDFLDQENQKLATRNERLRKVIDALLKYIVDLRRGLRERDQSSLDIGPAVF